MALIYPSKYMSTSHEYPLHLHGWLRIHKDGRCERFIGTDIVLAGTDPLTGVQSKDVVFSQEHNIIVRIYIPNTIVPTRKLPTLIYYHGGGFITETAVSPTYHPTLNIITKESDVVVVSVNYRLGPEYPIPIAYEDSWEAIKWVAAHVNGNGPEPWLNNHADLHNVFFAGDSAGGNISHNMAIRVGLNPIEDINLKGVIMLHPWFGGNDPIPDEKKWPEYKAFQDQVWKLASRSRVGLDDPLYNPDMDPSISRFGCSRILLCVGEKDKLRGRGLYYKKVMEKSGWKGKIQVMENKGEGRVFFLFNTPSENSRVLRNKICLFINPILSKA
ncbi:probable carboxylesterase 2 [Rutidosis leptorrhynchoides]|uniref:probable carboxylesterase 2 n=1 Tax=Rutidosis leptorrhynchoides TaxID=125765 RepID=UPI003A9926DC